MLNDRNSMVVHSCNLGSSGILGMEVQLAKHSYRSVANSHVQLYCNAQLCYICYQQPLHHPACCFVHKGHLLFECFCSQCSFE